MNWAKSSHCGNGACVEVAVDDQVYVRATQDPDVVLAFSPQEWAVFVDGVKAGEFDIPSTKE
jgi:predicted secreted Zn-dependent protease